MKVKTNIKAGGSSMQHNQIVARCLKIKTSEECARGTAFGWLSIFGGGLLGGILGYCGAKKS